MSHAIEAAKSGRATCATCGEKIAKGETRVAELYQDTNFGRYQYEERYRGGGDSYRVRADSREPIQRFHHLACAVEKHPTIVASALKRPFDGALIPDRAKVEAQVAAALEEERKARVAAMTAKLGQPQEAAASDPNLDPMLEQLADAPEDPELVGVIGDLFQSRNDPRGELIVMQMAMRNAKRERGPEVANPRGRTRTHEVEDPTQKGYVQRRDELMAHLTPRLDSGDRSIWGLGFIRRIELGPKSSSRIQELAGLWSHMSVRVLSELRIELPPASNDGQLIGHLAQVLPRSLRKLEIGGSPTGGTSLQPLLAALPRLEELVLLGRMPDGELAHATLSKLALHGITQGYARNPPPYAALAVLQPARLPAVREIAFRRWSHLGNPLGELARSRWISVVERVVLDEPVGLGTESATSSPSIQAVLDGTAEAPRPVVGLPIEAAQALRDGLAGRKLARLEISGCPITLPVRALLTPLCDELVCPTFAVVLDENTTHVTHANKPEWGKGKIVKRADGKLEVKFPKDGVKVFKADAPFLVPAEE